MDQQTLHLFCKQLIHWAEDILESGRSPFRRAEPFFPLLTAAGEISPPLILWINRDSCMAGGVLLFPDICAEESLADGRACAQALGLRHFVTWAPREIAIWEERGDTAVRCKVLPMPDAGSISPALFCDLFRKLLEELKPLAVSGAVPAADLSPFYLANLCRLARRSATPFLTEAFRIARGEDRQRSTEVPASAALQQAHLTFLRQMALLLEDRLPPTIQPEGFDRALRFALDSLPPALRRPLEINPWEIPLPPASAVRLQYLNRRLTQLNFVEDIPRCLHTVEILIKYDAGELGGFSLPPLPGETSTAALLLHPDHCYAATEIMAEIAPSPLLAFTALLRHLRGEKQVHQAAHSFALGEMSPPALIRGILHAGGTSTANNRQRLTAGLRRSWPNRRFSFPPGSPDWLYEFLHLLGLAGDGARVVLDIPDTWLTAPYGVFLHAVIVEHFSLGRLERLPEGVRIDLRKRVGTGEITILNGAEGERRIPWAQLQENSLSFLSLALDLPAPLLLLLEDRRLQVTLEWPADKEAGIFLFSRSSLGRTLWRVVSNDRPLPPRANLASLQRQGFPLPAREILHQLQSLSTGTNDEPPRAVLDRELTAWLGVDLTTRSGSDLRHGRPRRSPAATADVLEQIRRTVFVDGLPRFPEQYLYDCYRPQMIEYRFTAPLTIGENFFSQQTLLDLDGKVLTIEGSETARALLLASFSGDSPVFLPADRHLTAAVLERYLNTLCNLRQGLVQESHRLLLDRRIAETAVETIWESLPLPPWSLVAE